MHLVLNLREIFEKMFLISVYYLCFKLQLSINTVILRRVITPLLEKSTINSINSPLKPQSSVQSSELTCHREFLGSAGHLLVPNADCTLIFASVGDSGLGQWVQKVVRAAGGLGVDDAAVLEYSVLTTQHLPPEAADDGQTPQGDIGAPLHLRFGVNGQGDGAYCESYGVDKITIRLKGLWDVVPSSGKYEDCFC